MFLKRANASLSFPPPIYKPSMEEARWGAVSPRNACPSAQHSGQMLAFEGKTRSHSRAFTRSSSFVVNGVKVRRNQPQGSKIGLKVRTRQNLGGSYRSRSGISQGTNGNLECIFCLKN